MTTPTERDNLDRLLCPVCGTPLRKETDGVRNPPMPGVFWFCTNGDCDDGKRNKIYSGG